MVFGQCQKRPEHGNASGGEAELIQDKRHT